MNITIEDSTKLFFTSDLHFYHENIIDYSSRPFRELSTGQNAYYNFMAMKAGLPDEPIIPRLEQMHKAIISKWNNKIPKDGIVFIVGDFAFISNIKKIKELLDQLNGTKYLIFGNHDYQNKFDRQSIRELFIDTADILDVKILDDEITDGFQWINLCHYPIESWSKKAKGSWHLHGHIHSGPLSSSSDGNIKFYPNRYDVGVDNNNFTPVSYQEVKTIITKQKLKGKK